MIRAMTIAVAAAAGLALSLHAYAFENEPTGFRGVEWGTPIEKAHGLYLFDHQIGDRVSYRRSFEDLSVNGIPLDALYFDFYKGRFEEAVLLARRHLGGELLQTLTARYGTPSQPKGRKKQFLWRGSVSTILLTCTARLVTCTAVIASNEMLRSDQAGRTEAARNSDKDF